jgi:hypothetical protein
MKDDSLERLIEDVLANQDARVAAHENALRRTLAVQFNAARGERAMSFRDLASAMGTSLSQVQRVLHEEVGGSLTLNTVCRAADALGQRVSLHVRPESPVLGEVLRFGTSVPWKSSDALTPSSASIPPREGLSTAGRWKDATSTSVAASVEHDVEAA